MFKIALSLPMVSAVVAASDGQQLPQKGTEEGETPPPIRRIVEKVYQLESSGGKFDSCKRYGKFNGYGYIPGTCFDSHEAVEILVSQWFEKHLQEMTLSEALCHYNQGLTTKDCNYYQKYKMLTIK